VVVGEEDSDECGWGHIRESLELYRDRRAVLSMSSALARQDECDARPALDTSVSA
jgi:hypothetical protein